MLVRLNANRLSEEVANYGQIAPSMTVYSWLEAIALEEGESRDETPRIVSELLVQLIEESLEITSSSSGLVLEPYSKYGFVGVRVIRVGEVNSSIDVGLSQEQGMNGLHSFISMVIEAAKKLENPGLEVS